MLRSIEHVGRRETLVGMASETEGVPTYRFDIRLQGDRETVFLDM